MFIKKLLSVLLIISMIFSLSGCGLISSLIRNADEILDELTSALEQEIENDFSDDSLTDMSPLESIESDDESKNQSSTPLLYKVTDNKGNIIWLFGSIHVGEDYFYPLPDYVLDAFNKADSLAVEFDIVAYEKNLKAQMQSLKAFVYTDGTKISDHLPNDIYNNAKTILKEQKMYNSSMDYYNVAMWSSLIDNAIYEKIGVNYKLGVDRHLINLAYDKDKTVLDIESADFQYNMLSGFSEKLQLMLLESSIESYNNEVDIKMQLDGMMQVWAKGDEEKLSQMVAEDLTDEEFTEEESKLLEEYNTKMITNRNRNMTEWAKNALKNGKKVFICVGAAHIVGEGAIADELEKAGYTVEIIK